MTEPREIALQFLVKFRSGQDYKHVDDPAGSVPVYGSGGIFASASDYLYDGESVLFGRKGTIDRPAHVCGKFWTVDTMFYTELREGVSGRWLYYWATTIPFGLYSTDTALPSMTSSVLGRIKAPLVPYVQQCAIADYLDRETGEIDAMLAMLDVLNEALNSRRASVVERETIARPGSLTRFKFCADISLGKTFQGVRKSGHEISVNYVRAASIQPSGLELDDQRMWMTQEEQRKYDLRKGDVLVVEGGAGFGRSVHLAQDMPGWGFQNHVIRVRPDRHHDGRFLNYCVKGHYSSGLIGLLADGATIPGLSSDKAKNLPIPDMSLEEQQRIADHLDEVTGRIDAMLATIDQLKALLVERRAALITDVVTGRKKVPA